VLWAAVLVRVEADSDLIGCHRPGTAALGPRPAATSSDQTSAGFSSKTSSCPARWHLPRRPIAETQHRYGRAGRPSLDGLPRPPSSVAAAANRRMLTPAISVLVASAKVVIHEFTAIIASSVFSSAYLPFILAWPVIQALHSDAPGRSTFWLSQTWPVDF
jgi:hypothetical protein